jgi:hypothetical protein
MAVNNYFDNSELAERVFIANSQVFKTSPIHKFGAVPAMSTGQGGTVWDIDDTLYPWAALDTPAVLNVERNSPDDEGSTVTIQGLDSNYEFQEETVTISGTDTLGTKLFRRVNRAFCSSNGDTNTGNIDIEAGAAGGTTVARITQGKGQTLMAVYTVPAGHTAYLVKTGMTVAGTADATGDLFIRYTDQDTFRVAHSFEVTGAGGAYQYEFTIPIRITEKSDIDVRADVRSNNARCTAVFDIILIKN